MKNWIAAFALVLASAVAAAQPAATAGNLPVIKWTLQRAGQVVAEGTFLATPGHMTELHPEGKSQEFTYTSACQMVPGGTTKVTRKTEKLGFIVAVTTGSVGISGAEVNMGLIERTLVSNRQMSENGCTVDLPTFHEEAVSRDDSLAAGVASQPVPLGEYAVSLAYIAPAKGD